MSAWTAVPLASVLTHTIGGLWGAEPGADEVDVRVLRVTEMRGYGLDPRTAATRSISQRQLSARRLAAGDLLLEKSGGGPNTPVGRVGLVNALGEEPCICSNFMQLMRPDPAAVIPRYVHLYLNYFHMIGGTASMQTASTNIRNIKSSDFLKVLVPLPDLEEQRHIVELLEDHLSRLDAAASDMDSAAARLDVLRGQVLNQALAMAESSSGSDSRASLSSLVSPGRSLAYGVLVPGPDVEGGVPLVRVGDIRGGQVRLSELKTIALEVSNRYPRTLLRGGELLLSLVGTIGRTGVAPSGLANANVARAVGVLPLRDGIEARFVSMLLEAPRSNRALNGLAHEVARKTLNLEDVKSFELPIPSHDAQLRIVAAAEESLSAVRRGKVAAAWTKSRTSALHLAMLSAAFSGRLTRRSADPDHHEEVALV